MCRMASRRSAELNFEGRQVLKDACLIAGSHIYGTVRQDSQKHGSASSSYVYESHSQGRKTKWLLFYCRCTHTEMYLLAVCQAFTSVKIINQAKFEPSNFSESKTPKTPEAGKCKFFQICVCVKWDKGRVGRRDNNVSQQRCVLCNYSSDSTRTRGVTMFSRVPEIEVSEVEVEQIEKHEGRKIVPSSWKGAQEYLGTAGIMDGRWTWTHSPASTTWTDDHLKWQWLAQLADGLGSRFKVGKSEMACLTIM